MFEERLLENWNYQYSLLQQEWGVDSRLSYLVGLLQGLFVTYGLDPVTITSGYRSPERQYQLQNRWDAGDRRGLVARPASSSWHMQGLAVDVSTRSINFDLFRENMELFDGVRWGGRFRKPDPVHFDLPIGRLRSIRELLTVA
ncbi:MAG: DUF882 domain-containing protein [Boseongicola sp. SB0673_bin_14]|nr:DUF882 domain-containing protein [Boseongicola sp. SB0673_bin_14]